MHEITNGELSRWLGRIESKLDKVTDDHEARIRRVERLLYTASGVAIAAGAGTGFLSALAGGG